MVYAGTKARHLPNDNITLKSMSNMHSILKEQGYLCDKDIKGKNITLQVDLFEIQDVCNHIHIYITLYYF